MVELALRYHDKGVVGIDMAGGETYPIHQLHIDGFKVSKCMLYFDHHMRTS